MPRRGVPERQHDIAWRLLQIRTAADMTQKAFCDSLGIPFRTYVEWEIGRRDPSVRGVAAIAEKYDVDPRWILFGPGETPVRSSDITGVDRESQIAAAIQRYCRQQNIHIDPGQVKSLTRVVVGNQLEAESRILERALTVFGLSAPQAAARSSAA